jgi:hypothetical protein
MDKNLELAHDAVYPEVIKINNYDIKARLYSKVWPMLSIFDSNKQKTPLEISVVFDREHNNHASFNATITQPCNTTIRNIVTQQ